MSYLPTVPLIQGICEDRGHDSAWRKAIHRPSSLCMYRAMRIFVNATAAWLFCTLLREMTHESGLVCQYSGANFSCLRVVAM